MNFAEFLTVIMVKTRGTVIMKINKGYSLKKILKICNEMIKYVLLIKFNCAIVFG